LCYPTFLREAEESKEKNELPLGVVLYFCFVKMVLAFLLLRLLVFDLYNMLASVYGNYCANLNSANVPDLCTTTVSAYNLKSASSQTQLNVLDILCFTFVLLAILFFVLFRKLLNHQRNAYIPFPFFNEKSYAVLV
jgi:hypothetical protein